MRILFLFISLLLFISCGEARVSLYDEEMELSHNYKLLKAYFYHPERIKDFKEYEGFEVDSMYKSLGDYFKGGRYTFYSPPSKADDKIDQIENTPKYYSFGFERYIAEGSDILTVTAVYPISPAADAGLRKRDKLLLANGIPLTGEDAELYLKSDSQFATSTVFTVLREGKEITLAAMIKREIKKPTVYLDSATIEGERIPFISVTEYTINTNNPSGTYGEFKEVLKQINGAKTAIMDLRNNPGGNIYHCTAMAAELVPFDSQLLYDEIHYYDGSRGGNIVDVMRYFAKDFVKSEGIGASINWILLVNRYTASCAERFAAALKYNRPETIIEGETTYGKGIGQTYTKTYLGGLAYITCLQSFYPDGKTFHEVGIEPNRSQGILAKRASAPASFLDFPPARETRDIDLGMHKQLFH